MVDEPVVVPAGQLTELVPQTPGLVRQEAFAPEGVWVGVMTSAGGEMSAWHHHGDHETFAYVISGVKRMEFGPGGRKTLTADPGAFIHLPKRFVHREGASGAEECVQIVFRTGQGPTVVNVDGPGD